jgi:hypothetical protein
MRGAMREPSSSERTKTGQTRRGDESAHGQALGFALVAAMRRRHREVLGTPERNLVPRSSLSCEVKRVTDQKWLRLSRVGKTLKAKTRRVAAA